MTERNIMVVDDDPRSIRLLSRILLDVAEIRVATGGAEAMVLAREQPPDLMLLDAEMSGMSGFQVCNALKADKALADVPVIFITGHCQPAFEIAGFEAGANDFIAKPINAQLLLARVRAQLRIKQMADELREISTLDSLTGLANRRRLDDALEREWRRGRRRGSPLSLLMLDVDHFKLFNDRYGHPAGDRCLQQVARALAAACHRPADTAARYGGEEFALLLPETARDGAAHVARRLLDSIDALAIPHAASPTATCVTVSLGVGVYDEDSVAWVVPSTDTRQSSLTPGLSGIAVDLVMAADTALYVVKGAGRAGARLLDVADAEAPILAKDIAPFRDGWRSRIARHVQPGA
jgi:diguanylate cyclase (GGDEF)-like protein